MKPLILRLDISGTPVTWLPWQDAVSLYCRDMVGWTAGDETFTFHGGTNKKSGLRSTVSINSIIAVKRSRNHKHIYRTAPPLTNRELFLRDARICMYCGNHHKGMALTRDHVIPMSRGALTAGQMWSLPAGHAIPARATGVLKRPECRYWQCRMCRIGPNISPCRTEKYWPTRWNF